MIHTANTVRTLQAVAMSVVVALLLWSTGLPTIFRFAEAASITNASDTVETSAPSASSNHTIEFTTPNGLVIGQTILLTFPTGVNEFVLGSIGVEDVDILVNGSSSSTALVAGADTWGVSTTSSSITFTTPTNSGVASATPIIVRIGNHAVTSGTGDTKIANPSATGSYGIDIGGTMQDSGQVRVAIVSEVVVSASVDATLTFAVSGVASGQAVNGSPTTTATTTTATTLPFGTLVATGTSKVLAHDLAVTTNARNGYTVTVEQTGDLQSTTGATIEGFIDGANTTTPSPWQAPARLIADPDTYGHWGLTSSDGDTTRSAEFTSDTWVSGSTTPVVVMGHTGPSDGLTAGVGSARIGYQIQITPLQEAGDDYTTTLRYIVTPTF
jgi:hypothetical protein